MARKNVGGTSDGTGEDAGTAEQSITAKIAALGDWRGAMLASIRRLVRQADPMIVEEVKWRKPSNPSGVPVWSHGGILCTGETYKDKVKLTFAQGGSLPDPSGLFNAGLDGGTRRAIDLRDGDAVDEAAHHVADRRMAGVHRVSGHAVGDGDGGEPPGQGGDGQVPGVGGEIQPHRLGRGRQAHETGRPAPVFELSPI